MSAADRAAARAAKHQEAIASGDLAQAEALEREEEADALAAAEADEEGLVVAGELEEDWQQSTLRPARKVSPKLAGLYLVEHGRLFFNKDKIVDTGRKVKLSAEEAFHFLQLDLPADKRPEKRAIRKLADLPAARA